MMQVLEKHGLAKVAMFGIPCDYIDSETLGKGEQDLIQLYPRPNGSSATT